MHESHTVPQQAYSFAMAISYPFHFCFFFPILLLITTSIDFLAPIHGQCLDDQKASLLKLRSELNFNSSNSPKLTSWNQTNDCCSWDGLNCDEEGHIIYLDLKEEAVSGELDDSSSLLSLRYLQYLNLAYNSFNSRIPLFLFSLPLLQSLDLSNNQFHGQLSEFPTLNSSNLVELDLAYNRLEGAIPDSLFQFQYLESLSLSDNLFNSRIPLFLFSLPLLQSLDLSNNQFHGQLSEFRALNPSNLVELDLSYNRLEGPIPYSLFQFQNLESLSLSNNLFNGTFQLDKIQSFPNLTFLDLSNNNLSVDVTNMSLGTHQLTNLLLGSCNLHGSFGNSSAFPQLQVLDLSSCNLHKFPHFIKELPLRLLDLSSNKIAGEIPSWIWEIGNGTLFRLNLSSNLLVDLQKPYHIPASLWMLDLHSNMLRGELPLTPSGYVDYSNNNFDKSIPVDIGNVLRRYLSLANNSLSGAIPASLCSANSTYLLVLDLSFNGLSGDIPRCLFQNMSELGVLNLERNNLSGYIPDRFPVNCSLQTLDLSHNNFKGRIPKSLGYCEQLQVTNVGSNDFDDTFPCMLPASLRLLVLRSNRFHGEIKCHKSWPSLQIIDIASNNFSGSLDRVNFSRWRGMMLESDAELKQNHLGYIKKDYIPNFYLDEVTLIIKGLGLKLAKIRGDFTAIDFSCNNFHGDVPDAVGNLRSLYLLNLSYNSLVGTIPKSFGNLTQLGSLDLSTNQLTGTIPEEFAQLTFLSVLNLSYNKLVGVIPKGRQIQTFPADSFEGNPGLCGFPLNISCNYNNLSPPEHENVQSETDIEWGYVFGALGYAVGLGIIVWVLLFCQRFRQKYFDKVDEVVEEILDGRNRRRRRAIKVVRNRTRRQ